MAEGGAVDLAVSVDRGPRRHRDDGRGPVGGAGPGAERFRQASTYRLSLNRVELPAVAIPVERQSATTVVRLEALADELVNDDPLTLDLGKPAYGAGTVNGSFAIKVRDTTVKQIAPKLDVAVKEAFGDAVTAAAGPTAGTRGTAPPC